MDRKFWWTWEWMNAELFCHGLPLSTCPFLPSWRKANPILLSLNTNATSVSGPTTPPANGADWLCLCRRATAWSKQLRRSLHRALDKNFLTFLIKRLWDSKMISLYTGSWRLPCLSKGIIWSGKAARSDPILDLYCTNPHPSSRNPSVLPALT